MTVQLNAYPCFSSKGWWSTRSCSVYSNVSRSDLSPIIIGKNCGCMRVYFPRCKVWSWLYCIELVVLLFFLEQGQSAQDSGVFRWICGSLSKCRMLYTQQEYMYTTLYDGTMNSFNARISGGDRTRVNKKGEYVAVWVAAVCVDRRDFVFER